MKKVILSMFVAMMATIAAQAQQIAVVSGGSTSLYRTLQEAINGALPGSVIYLPGGGFTINDEVKITKKLDIIGIGHKAREGNSEANTSIIGNLFFSEGSSTSSLIGCNLTGDIIIGDEDKKVTDIHVRLCNIGSLNIKNSYCEGTTINRCYVRGSISYGGTTGDITNNIIAGRVTGLNGGLISCNIVLYSTLRAPTYGGFTPPFSVTGCSITDNIITGSYCNYNCSNCYVEHNMTKVSDWGINGISLDYSAFDNLFKHNAGASTASNFHFSDEYAQYEGEVGIYAGTSFDEDALPVPCIIKKDVNPQTDTSGMLKVTISVKAAE